MSVHYKFKSSLDFDTITFDGLHISVADLKKSIVHQKRLGKTGDFDLQITNAQTKEEYPDDSALIPKNTSLIIARIPLVSQPRKNWEPNPERVSTRPVPESEPSQVDLSRMNGTEEDKIKAMMAQSTMDYDPTNYQKIRGASQIGEVPLNYRCYRCHKQGHWIKHCPLGPVGVKNSYKETEKRNTGIPRSFIDGQNTNAQQSAPVQQSTTSSEKTEIPEDLICSICKSLFVDAVMIPCCGSSFCDECVRTALLESEDNECPDCNEKGTSPGSLIPNRFLRNSVNSFKNETGYNKPRPNIPRLKPVEKTKVVEEEITEEAKEEEILEEQVDEEAESKMLSEEEKEDNESDYEDNITVTVPPAHLTSHVAYEKRNMMFEDYPRIPRLKPPGLDTPPKPSVHYQNVSQEERSSTPTIDEKETYSSIPSTEQSRPSQHQQQQQPPTSQHQPMHQSNVPPHVQQSANGYGGGPPHMHYQQNQIPRQYEGGEYGPSNYPPPGGYPPHMGGGPYRHERPRGPFMQPRIPYGNMHNPMIRGPRHTMLPNSLAQVYQGVQAKVGTGIIDDPLEAFNRIMREKERRKEERRRSPHPEHGRRSRSHEMDRRRPSLERRRTPRIRSPNDRRRTPEVRRGRSHLRESAERKRRHSSSYSRSSRSSRSFSRSRSPPRKRSLTPIQRKRSRTPPMRRSRTRSPSFSISRSRSKSISSYNRKDTAPLRLNHSSQNRTISPRYNNNNRFRNNNRRDGGGGGRDYEYREKSPFYLNSRGRGGPYRGRGNKNQSMQYRLDRMSNNMYKDDNNSYNQQHQQHNMDYHDGGQYSQNVSRYSPRNQQGPPQQQQQHHQQPPINRNTNYVPPLVNLKPHPRYDEEMGYRNMYEEGPPGVDEQPPPPGFETSVEPYDRDTTFQNTKHYYDEYGNPGNENSYNKNIQPEDIEMGGGNRKNERSHTPSPAELHERKRHSKSKSKEKHESRKERRGGDDKPKKEVTSKKVSEKSHEHKKRDSSDDEKRDKKLSREKKKKKKEKEAEKKKNKKDKREKREKEKKILERNAKAIKKEEKEQMQAEIESARAASQATPEPAEDNTDKDNFIDLYYDLPQENSKNVSEMSTDTENKSNVQETPRSPATCDPILDIHANLDFDTEPIEIDLIEQKVITVQTTTTTTSSLDSSVLVSLPEPSKWELDEDTGQLSEKKTSTENDDSSSPEDDKSGKVTNEVLKRAENAIFARAINAIRPIEIKKISLERQKLYSNDKSSTELSPVTSVVIKANSPPKETFQITVPTNRDSAERSVEIKQTVVDPVQKPSSRISVKERLGSKVIETPRKSFSKSPVRKVQLESVRRPPSHHSNDRNKKEERASRSNQDDRRNIRGGNENSNNNNNNNNSNPRENRRTHDHHRSRDHENRGRDEEPDRRTRIHDNTGTIRTKYNENTHRDKYRERHERNVHERRTRSKERSRNRSPETSKNRDHPKSIDRHNKTNDRDASRLTDRKRKKSRSRSADKKKERKSNKKDDETKKNTDSSNVKEKRSSASKNTAEEKQEKQQKDTPKIDRKRSMIDEANFVPDYDEQMEHESNADISSDKTTTQEPGTEENAVAVVEKPAKKSSSTNNGNNGSSTNNKKESKKHRSTSTDEQSSDSSDSESDSSDNSDDSSNRRRKKRKHKKQKKIKKSTGTSSDTDESPKKKKKKDKKSKSSKKKKKNKHK